MMEVDVIYVQYLIYTDLLPPLIICDNEKPVLPKFQDNL